MKFLNLKWLYLVAATGLISAASLSSAVTTFDFETANQLDNPLVTGDTPNYIQTAEQALASTQSLRFDYTTPDAYQSWTYDIPFTIQDGTVSVWFYDALGGNIDFNKFGGSIILEDKDTPGDFLAVEVWNGPYPSSTDPTPGVANYYLTRGSSSGATTFKSRYFGDRSVGWHQVVFNISAASSTVSVDGISNSEASPTPPTGPGSADNLRVRFMAWSASDGGFGNWTTATTSTAGFTITDPYVFYDDLTVTATTPAAATVSEGFEIVSGTATYDAPTEFMGPSGFDNVNMKNLVPQWNPNTNATFVHSGSQSISFTNEDPTFKSIVFDLASATAGDITLQMYDSLGPNDDFDKVGGSIIIEQASDPSNFIAAEVWNAPYPMVDPTPGAPNYYLVKGTSGSQATTFKSAYFGDRAVGWRTVTISLTATTSKIMIDGVENSNGAGIITGPGLNDGIRLRLMSDSPSCGGFTNYLDPATDELQHLYLEKTATYLYFDSMVLPITSSTVDDWMAY